VLRLPQLRERMSEVLPRGHLDATDSPSGGPYDGASYPLTQDWWRPIEGTAEHDCSHDYAGDCLPVDLLGERADDLDEGLAEGWLRDAPDRYPSDHGASGNLRDIQDRAEGVGQDSFELPRRTAYLVPDEDLHWISQQGGFSAPGVLVHPAGVPGLRLHAGDSCGTGAPRLFATCEGTVASTPQGNEFLGRSSVILLTVPKYPFAGFWTKLQQYVERKHAGERIAYGFASELHADGSLHLHFVLASEDGKKIRGGSKELSKHLLVKRPGFADPVIQIQQLDPSRAGRAHATRLGWALGYLQKSDWWIIHRSKETLASAPEDEAPPPPKKDKRGTKNMVADLIVEGKDLPTIVMQHPELRGFISTNVRQLRDFAEMMTSHQLRSDPIWPELGTPKWHKIEMMLLELGCKHWARYVAKWGDLPFERLREKGLPNKAKLFGKDADFEPKDWWMYKIVTWIMDNFCRPRNREQQQHLMIQSRTGQGKTGLIDAMRRITTVYSWCYENGTFQTAPDDMDVIVFDEFQCNLPIGTVNAICDGTYQINKKGMQPKRMEWDIPCIMLTNVPLEEHYGKLLISLKEKGVAEAENILEAYKRRWKYVEIPGRAMKVALKPLSNALYHLGTALMGSRPIIKKHRRLLEATATERPIPDWIIGKIEEIKNM